ncbi:hypothetical protein DFJ43DRAFT_306777 [Lentinula guzmanii]|uniref:Uncharacterized protein n=1 Tax=Lentinula guzmanii TaxID=2804957 RepID=A0AA38N180_9AGAR|nr:hypothetical protein DFJ43DRAFT_306777 [Lentinula guzmanii]
MHVQYMDIEVSTQSLERNENLCIHRCSFMLDFGQDCALITVTLFFFFVHSSLSLSFSLSLCFSLLYSFMYGSCHTRHNILISPNRIQHHHQAFVSSTDGIPYHIITSAHILRRTTLCIYCIQCILSTMTSSCPNRFLLSKQCYFLSPSAYIDLCPV